MLKSGGCDSVTDRPRARLPCPRKSSGASGLTRGRRARYRIEGETSRNVSTKFIGLLQFRVGPVHRVQFFDSRNLSSSGVQDRKFFPQAFQPIVMALWPTGKWLLEEKSERRDGMNGNFGMNER